MCFILTLPRPPHSLYPLQPPLSSSCYLPLLTLTQDILSILPSRSTETEVLFMMNGNAVSWQSSFTSMTRDFRAATLPLSSERKVSTFSPKLVRTFHEKRTFLEILREFLLRAMFARLCVSHVLFVSVVFVVRYFSGLKRFIFLKNQTSGVVSRAHACWYLIFLAPPNLMRRQSAHIQPRCASLRTIHQSWTQIYFPCGSHVPVL